MSGWQPRVPDAELPALSLPSLPCQLLSSQVTALAGILEKANSCYWPALQSMFRDVSAGKPPGDVVGSCLCLSGEASPSPTWSFSPGPGLEEAKDVSLHLQPLRILLEEMEQVDYSQVSCVWQNNQALPGFIIQVEAATLSTRGCLWVWIHPGSA